MNRTKNLIYLFLFFALIFGVWIGITFLEQPKTEDVNVSNGNCNLATGNFEDNIYKVDNKWNSWPKKLYTPKDFKENAMTASPTILNKKDYKKTEYATHKITLSLPPGETYGIAMLTSEYAMRLYIDGKEIDSVGSPNTARETTEHRALERTYYFTTESGNVEIIVQAANFVHAKGGSWPPTMYLGKSSNITRWEDVNQAVNYMIIGCLITACLYHLGIFCLNRSRKNALRFAICCFLMALLNKKLILMFWPNYNWEIGIRIEYLIHFLTFVSVVFFLDKLRPQLLKKPITYGYYGLAGVFILTLFLDSKIFTKLLLYFEVASIVMIIYIIFSMVLRLKNKKMIDMISFIGVAVLSILAVNDILYYRGIEIIPPISGQFFMTPIGLIFFVLCYALVLSLQNAETEEAMLEAQSNEKALSLENEALDRMNKMKTELMTTISHETRTPLAVLASYSGLVSMELRDKGVDTEMAEDLDKIAFEAKRVAELIDGMKRITMDRQKVDKKTMLDIGSVVSQTTRLYIPILQRKNIKLEIDIEENLRPVLGSPEEITQVLFNILQNARNHTDEGRIAVKVKQEDGYIITSVTDTGNGISKEILPYVFEKGTHDGEGGLGLGLFISKEIVVEHGGSIHIESDLRKGTEVSFALPTYEGELK